MVNADSTLSGLIKEQIKLEHDTARKLGILVERMDSVAARLLIREMQLDSKKHAEILEAVLKAMKRPESLWEFTLDIEADKRAVKKELQKHIEVEEKMMRQIAEETRKTNDEAVKLLLKHFEEDEKKHHASIRTILSKAYKMEI